MIIKLTYTDVDCITKIEQTIVKSIVVVSDLGAPGASAYQIAVANGFVGTEAEWLEQMNPLTHDLSEFPNESADPYIKESEKGTEIVKADEAISKGQAVYVSGSNGTNILVKKASNTTEATSSKTLGLLIQDLAHNGIGKVKTEGLLAGLNTSSATIGDPVWLGTNGDLIYGLVNKPYAPAHLVYLGVVTRVHANQGEIFVHVQNGFELREIHDVVAKDAIDNQGLYYQSTTGVWESKYSWFQCASGFNTYEWITNTTPLKELHYTYSWGELWRKIDATSDNFYTDSGYTIIYQKKKI